MQQLTLSRPETGASDFDQLIGPHLEAGYRTALAILRNPDEATVPRPVAPTILIIHGDGSVTKFSGNYEPAW